MFQKIVITTAIIVSIFVGIVFIALDSVCRKIGTLASEIKKHGV